MSIRSEAPPWRTRGALALAAWSALAAACGESSAVPAPSGSVRLTAASPGPADEGGQQRVPHGEHDAHEPCFVASPDAEAIASLDPAAQELLGHWRLDLDREEPWFDDLPRVVCLGAAPVPAEGPHPLSPRLETLGDGGALSDGSAQWSLEDGVLALRWGAFSGMDVRLTRAADGSWTGSANPFWCSLARDVAPPWTPVTMARP